MEFRSPIDAGIGTSPRQMPAVALAARIAMPVPNLEASAARPGAKLSLKSDGGTQLSAAATAAIPTASDHRNRARELTATVATYATASTAPGRLVHAMTTSTAAAGHQAGRGRASRMAASTARNALSP